MQPPSHGQITEEQALRDRPVPARVVTLPSPTGSYKGTFPVPRVRLDHSRAGPHSAWTQVIPVPPVPHHWEASPQLPALCTGIFLGSQTARFFLIPSTHLLTIKKFQESSKPLVISHGRVFMPQTLANVTTILSTISSIKKVAPLPKTRAWNGGKAPLALLDRTEENRSSSRHTSHYL